MITNFFSIDELVGLGADKYFVNDVLTNPLYFSKLMVEDDGKIVCASLVRLTSEITILFGKDSCNITKARALKELLEHQVKAGKSLGIDQVHAFTDINVDTMLHLGFKERNEKPFILHF